MNIVNTLQKQGFEVTEAAMTAGLKGLWVSTESGAYPQADTFRKINEITKIATKAGYKAETRGFYTSVLVYKEA